MLYMHLLYSRFFVKAFKSMGMIDFDEPFKNLLNSRYGFNGWK